MATIDRDVLTRLAAQALLRAGASRNAADSTAKSLVLADVQGLASHGVSRIPQYVSHLRLGRVDGGCQPEIIRQRGGAVLIDAHAGFAFPALDLAVSTALQRVRQQGVVFVGIRNSHHFGAAGNPLLAVAEAGFVGFLFGNSPAAIPAWGGRRALYGTNPVAAVCPRRQASPLLIDLSLSEVARGKLMLAAQDKRAIPLGWALDRDGHPTTDPQAGLDGMMCPAGGVKGAMLALLVELLCTTLTGAALGFEADSFFQEHGNQPRIGQALLVLDPGGLAGQDVYSERIESLIQAMLQDEGVRLPGARRQALQQQNTRNGLEIADALLARLHQLAGSEL
jgi:(2R)-3-sulfolactate dehydrogenase (NADP+)